MNKRLTVLGAALVGGLWAVNCLAFSSGSTGADGVFNPTTSQSLQLPPDGVFHFTTVDIPAGVTISFLKNAGNTPVTILASGDVTIAGTISVSGSGPANPANISGPGEGGPGGFNGGRGGAAAGVVANWVVGSAGPNVGQAGIGPGGGAPGVVRSNTYWFGNGYWELAVGGGGAYGVAPPAPGGYCPTTPGVVYGTATLILLVGGSGGGGGAGGAMFPGSGGGGGGGAILIAASGALNVTGAILANGGVPISPGSAQGVGSWGGGGSGGAIRLIASAVKGNGTINAVGGNSWTGNYTSTSYGAYGSCPTTANGSQHGGAGRIRIEYETLLRTTPTSPAWLGGAPSLISVPSLPTLAIASIGGLPVPAQPSGDGDVSLPANFTNPVTVTFVTTGVTVGSSVKLTVMPVRGTAFSVTSAPTTETTASASTSVSVTLPPGQNVLQASVTYTVVASVGDAMSVYAQGERVEKVQLASIMGAKASTVTLITISGKEYVVPASVLAAIQL